VVSNVPVDDEAPSVTSGISRSVGAQSFRGAHRGESEIYLYNNLHNLSITGASISHVHYVIFIDSYLFYSPIVLALMKPSTT
jgi:hypothetical protein